jgi:hypothetical protein
MHAGATLVALGLLVVAVVAPAAAQRLDPASAEALGAVLRMFANPAQRGAAIGSDPRAQAADSQVRALARGDGKLMEDFYALAAQIFGELTQGSGGDVAKMTETLTRAQTDPAGLAALLSPATLARLRDLATRLSDQPRR